MFGTFCQTKKVMASGIIKCESNSQGLEVGILDHTPFLPPMKPLQELSFDQSNQLVDEPQVRGSTESSAPPSDSQKNYKCPICQKDCKAASKLEIHPHTHRRKAFYLSSLWSGIL